MKVRFENRYFKLGLTIFLVIAASILFYSGLFHLSGFINVIRNILDIFAPVIYGFAIGYVLSSVVNFLENRLFYPSLVKHGRELNKKNKKAVRWTTVFLAVTLMVLLIYALLMMVLPQLIRSIVNLIYSFPNYVRIIQKWMDNFTNRIGLHLDDKTMAVVNDYLQKAQDYLTNNLLPQMQDMLLNVSVGVFDFVIFIKNFFIGIIVAVYILIDKESFIARFKMLLYAFVPRRESNFVIRSMRFAHVTFGGFITGKILDSAIIGVLCYIGLFLMKMPYTLLVSVVIGVTNVIPFFGPFIGAIPCIILITVVHPIKGLYFMIFILILQQIDGNIIGPKILGDSTGLSSFMVIVAILVGGGFFGVPGMIIGVPLFAVFYSAFWKVTTMFLQKKGVPTSVESYMEIDCLDEDTGQAIPFRKKQEKKSRRPDSDSLFMKIWNPVEAVALFLIKSIFTAFFDLLYVLSPVTDKLLAPIRKYLKARKQRIRRLREKIYNIRDNINKDQNNNHKNQEK